mgnify:CR=1 FL=1
MLLKRLPGILPPLSNEELIETLKVKSLVTQQGLTTFSLCRPFRSPHHSISYAGLVGGGKNPRPGEISMAHNGVLFLDELPEFQRNVVEVLRQPLEDHSVTLSRANYSYTYPARFMLVAAMNPCPCGYFKDPLQECYCSTSHITKYWKKISGPILDRIDIILRVPRLEKNDLLDNTIVSEDSESILKRVSDVRQLQMNRSGRTNSALASHQIESECTLNASSKTLIGEAVDSGLLSGRSYVKVLKVARTIADMDGSCHITEAHILEALQYRKMDYSLAIH